MSGEDETKCVELTALEKNNESKEINQRSFAVSNKNTAGSEQDCNRKWRWIKLRPMRAGSVLDGGKSPLYKYWPYLEVALLSVVVVVVLLLMLLPTIFYHLPLPVRYWHFYLCMWYCLVSTKKHFPLRPLFYGTGSHGSWVVLLLQHFECGLWTPDPQIVFVNEGR